MENKLSTITNIEVQVDQLIKEMEIWGSKSYFKKLFASKKITLQYINEKIMNIFCYKLFSELIIHSNTDLTSYVINQFFRVQTQVFNENKIVILTSFLKLNSVNDSIKPLLLELVSISKQKIENLNTIKTLLEKG
jgi:hypothetical protein